MADKMSKETRSKIMKSIRSQTQLENTVSKELWRRGLRFRKNVKSLLGTPDIAIKKYKVVIFIDSCFWHYCPRHGHFPKSNEDYWAQKIYRNSKRDYFVTSTYTTHGWHILRIWEHQIKDDFDKCIHYILQFVKLAKQEK
jgi:DNA mismatch endonuclease (patch repair protein)